MIASPTFMQGSDLRQITIFIACVTTRTGSLTHRAEDAASPSATSTAMIRNIIVGYN